MTTDVFTPKVKLEHVISFSDAVFAFAITLMAISIDIPDLPTNLTQSQLLGIRSSIILWDRLSHSFILIYYFLCL